MRKTYVLLFLALFVAAGSMMFIGGVQQAHAQLQCPGNTAPCYPPCSAFPTVTVPSNASAVTVNCASNTCAATQSQCNYQAKTVGFTCNAGYTLSTNGQCVATSSQTWANAYVSANPGTAPSTISWGGSCAHGCYVINQPSCSTGCGAGTYTYTVRDNVPNGAIASDSATVTAACTPLWSPAPSTVCNGVSFTQTDSNNCETPSTRTATGTATCYACSGSTCSAVSSGTRGYLSSTCYGACTCTPLWSPAPSTVCNGVSFTQTDSNNCETPSTQTAIGTATCYACSGTTCSPVSSGTNGYLSSTCNNTCTPTPTFTIAPSPATIQVGGTQQYTGYYDPDGPSGPQASQPVSASSVVWSSSNTSAATIASSGVATGVAAGSTTISGTYNGITATANLNVQGTTADFSISVSPMSQSVAQGSSVAYTVTISPLNGFTGTVNLSKSNLTTGLSGTFSPTSVSGGGGTSQFTLSASASAALGASTFTITGTSGALSHSVTPTVNVTVGSPQPPTVSDTVPVDVYFCTSPSDPTPGCSSSPSCAISASPQSIMTGASSRLTWSCTGVPTTTSCLVSGSDGQSVWGPLSGWDGREISRLVRPRNTTRYALLCDLSGGTNVSADVEVHVGFLPVLREIIPQW